MCSECFGMLQRMFCLLAQAVAAPSCKLRVLLLVYDTHLVGVIFYLMKTHRTLLTKVFSKNVD